MIILMNGYTATGKTTVSTYLASQIPESKIFHTAVIRNELGLMPNSIKTPSYAFDLNDSYFVNYVSEKVYGKMLLECQKSLSNNVVILDGTFNFQWQREPFYKLAHQRDASLLIIRCVCNEESIIKERLNNRISSGKPFDEASEWKTYMSNKRPSLSIINDLMPKKASPNILVYDTYQKKIERSIDNNHDLFLFIYDILENWYNDG